MKSSFPIYRIYRTREEGLESPSVVIPNSGGRKGLTAAATLGAIVGHPERELEVLESATDEDRKWLGTLLSLIHI